MTSSDPKLNVEKFRACGSRDKRVGRLTSVNLRVK